MERNRAEDLIRILREQGVQYIVGSEGQPVAVLLTVEQYDHYLDLLDDEADGQDEELAVRLRQAAQPTEGERQSFRDYLHARETSRAQRRREDTYR
jgi:PHD/YefM family antitoxin component YafN of YafNO toxin-antitoxin module